MFDRLCNTRCDEDSSKECPHAKSVRISGPGVVSCSSSELLKCCKAKRQLEALKKIHNQIVKE